jgi:beta-lactamase superfamily II metal-dependent hydrolase
VKGTLNPGSRLGVLEDNIDVIAPPLDRLFSETNDNSVGILLSHGSERVLLAGDAERSQRST